MMRTRVVGLGHVIRRLDPERLVEAMHRSISRITDEVIARHNRRRRLQGASRNPLWATPGSTLKRVVHSQRHNPRRSGRSLFRKTQRQARSMAPRVIRKRLMEMDVV